MSATENTAQGDAKTAGARPGGPRGYKRSWRNLLINWRYQLRFTLFMVGLAALLIGALGAWVMTVADDATNVAIGRVRGDACPKGQAEPAAPSTGAAIPAPTAAEPPAAPGSGAGNGTAAAPAAPADNGEGRPRVQIDQSSMTLTVAPENFGDEVAAHWACELEQAARIRELEAGRRHILYVMIATGALLILGLAVYGILTTHKVAGPLFKIGLYLTKMREGRYDTVYPLRKGDQLIDFYDHFRAAHAGVVGMERADVERLRAAIEAAETGGLAGRSPEIDAALVELRGILARKEKSLE